MLLLLLLSLAGCTASVPELDIAQERLDVATPPLDGTHSIVQSFVCRHPNLYEIEILPAVYEVPGEGTLNLLLRSSGPQGHELSRLSIDAIHIRHNEPLHFTFTPQLDSSDKAYELWIEGSPGVRVGFWYSSVNAYGAGQLRLDGDDSAGDLRFTTRCRYSALTVAGEIGALLTRLAGGERSAAWLVIPVALVLLLPGHLLWHGLGLAKGRDPIADLALSLGLSLALIPLCLHWSTVLGFRWQRNSCQMAYLLLALCALFRLLRTRFADFEPWLAKRNRGAIILSLVLLSLALLLRFAQIRDLVVPAWVDSPQHVLIADLVVAFGQVPRSYEPFLPVQTFTYHFGFHAVTAVFHWISRLPIPQAMLLLGQILNAANALTAYLLTRRITGRRTAAIAAMLIVGLVSYMPAYYVSWGRYTQLTGMLLLPAALVTAIDWLGTERRSYRQLLVAGVMQTGLFLTHSRVAIFDVCFLIAYLLCESIARWRRGEASTNTELWKRSALLSLATLLLTGPWLLRVITAIHSSLRAAGRSLRGDPAYNAVPQGLLFAAHNRELMALAAVGATWGLLRRRRETAWVLIWCIVVALVINPGWLGLPNTNLVNNAAAVIALFLPLSVLSGQAVALLWDEGPSQIAAWGLRLRLPRTVSAAARATLLVLIAIGALKSAWEMVSIVNPVTVLATAEDLPAMDWVKENTRADAVFLINTRHWQLGTFTGTDGGYWIPRLTGRRTLLPELPYVYGRPEDVQHIADMAQTVAEAKAASDLQLQEIVEGEPVTHVYIGAKGGPLTPQMFLRSSQYRPVYSTGEVWIFEVTQ